MSKKTNRSDNNFKKAVNELLGYPVDEDLDDVDVLEPEGPQFFDMSDDDEEEVLDEDMTYSTESNTAPYQRIDTPVGTPEPMPEPAEPDSVPYVTESTIAADMEIMGNISSGSSMTISGRIIGNVVCGGSILIGGEVDGDVSAAEMEVWGSVSGNITVAGKVVICNGAQVKGDIIAHEVITDGTSEGDIKVEGKVVFQTSSVIMGNVYAKTFEMSAGTKIKGLVKTYD